MNNYEKIIIQRVNSLLKNANDIYKNKYHTCIYVDKISFSRRLTRCAGKAKRRLINITKMKKSIYLYFIFGLMLNINSETFVWDAPLYDVGGDPLTLLLQYELKLNDEVYLTDETFLNINLDTNFVFLIKARARCKNENGTYGEWSAESEMLVYNFPELTFNNNEVLWNARPPLTYKLLHSTNLINLSWNMVKMCTSSNQIERYTLIGNQGFFKLEGVK